MLSKLGLIEKLKKMASTPKQQLKQLLIGTLGALAVFFLITLTATLENQWLFYLLAFFELGFILYAIPGYLGIWLWRMRKFLFDMD